MKRTPGSNFCRKLIAHISTNHYSGTYVWVIKIQRVQDYSDRGLLLGFPFLQNSRAALHRHTRILTRIFHDSSEQYLNNDNVPLAIEKCVNFVSAHGSDTTGVYRLAGSHGKIERLVDSLKKSEFLRL